MKRFPGQFELAVITIHQNLGLALEQAKQFRPECVVITGSIQDETMLRSFEEIPVRLLYGREGLLEAAGMADVDLAVNALVGSAGLEATMQAIHAGTSIALANKEVLVMAGELVRRTAEQKSVQLLPIDSEHSALFQCLQGEESRFVDKIYLTASGGPFLKRNKDTFSSITVEEALKHPNWSMGKKVTIDSATMMNKALEIIEARWLFKFKADQIRVVVHPQSIVHSMIGFIDGSVKAQLGMPDMRIPISYALTYPERWNADYSPMHFDRIWELSFYPPDMDKFPALRLAYEVVETGGTAPAVLNGADESAVLLFLEGKIGFHQIPNIVENALNRHTVVANPDLNAVLEADRWVKAFIKDEFAPGS